MIVLGFSYFNEKIGRSVSMKYIKRLIHYYKPYKNMFFLDLFCAMLLSFIDLLFPMLVRGLLGKGQQVLESSILEGLLIRLC